MQDRSDLLPDDAKLQVTKGYAPMFGQLSRFLAFLADRRDAARVSLSEIAEGTGLAGPHAEHLGSILSAMDLVVPRVLRLSDLGEAVAEHDPFFGDMGTLWLCHYLIASNPRHIIWNRCCNRLLPDARPPVALSRAQFGNLSGHFSESTLKRHVQKEISSFVKAYTVHRFRNLDYLLQVDGRCYLADQPAPVPDLVLLATIVAYRDATHPGAAGMEIPLLCHGDNSPGRILHLNEWKLRTALESLARARCVEIESRANLDQIRFDAELTPAGVLAQYYQERY